MITFFKSSLSTFNNVSNWCFRMVEFIPADISIHRTILVEFNIEYLDWGLSEVQERYDIDLTSEAEQTVQEYVESNIESLAS